MKPLLLFFIFFFGVTTCAGANPIKENFLNGEEAYSNRDYPKACQYYEKVIELDPKFAPAYNALGLAHYAMGDDLKDVVWFFDRAVEIDPKYAEAYDNLCRIYYQAQQYNDAKKVCTKALTLRPGLVTSQLSLAWLLLQEGKNPEKAIYYFEEVLKRFKDPMVYYGLGLAYAQTGYNVGVLEMITTLRGKGKEEFAVQLEAAIRRREVQSSDPAVTFTNSSPTGPGPGGRIIKSNPPLPKSPSLQATGSVEGMTKVRLRGKLTSLIQVTP